MVGYKATTPNISHRASIGLIRTDSSMIYTTKLIHLRNNETGYYRFTHLPSHRHRGIAKVHPWYYRLWRSEGCWYLCQGTCAEAWTMLFRCRNQLRYLVKWKFICNFTPQYKTYHLTCGGCTTKVEPPAPFFELIGFTRTNCWVIYTTRSILLKNTCNVRLLDVLYLFKSRHTV